MEELKNVLKAGGVELSQQALVMAEQFCDFLLSENQKLNLTAIREKEDVYRKHILDSLAGLSFIEKGARVVEVGSGGGFPSVPLYLAKEGNFSLLQIESVAKKCAFLESVINKFAFSSVSVLCARAEEVAKDAKHREKYDVCLARAVAALNTLLEYCLPLVKEGGLFLAYKGSKEMTEKECKEALNALKILGGKIETILPFPISEQETHHLVVIRKVSSTPSKYPRGNGKERKNPL